jgi:hypothetical protein
MTVPGFSEDVYIATAELLPIEQMIGKKFDVQVYYNVYGLRATRAML